jgi:predicted methyltransferase
VDDERRGGPGSMSADELDAFIATHPSGAICVVDDDGRLLAVPARVLDELDGVLRVEISAAELDSMFTQERQACVVADSFESYDAIRGVIARGEAASADTTAVHPVVLLTTARTATFSFASSRREPEKRSGSD